MNLRIDYSMGQNGANEPKLKRERECTVRKRGSRLHSCAQSKVKRACVFLRKAVCSIGVSEEDPEYFVLSCSRSTFHSFLPIIRRIEQPRTYLRRSSRVRSRFGAGSREPCLGGDEKRSVPVFVFRKRRLTVYQAAICAPVTRPSESPRPL